jgi:hypothetical protein
MVGKGANAGRNRPCPPNVDQWLANFVIADAGGFNINIVGGFGAGKVTVVGGSGADTVVINDGQLTFTDTSLNGGTGTANTLADADWASSAADYAALNAMTGFQILKLVDGGGDVVNASLITNGINHFQDAASLRPSKRRCVIS